MKQKVHRNKTWEFFLLTNYSLNYSVVDILSDTLLEKLNFGLREGRRERDRAGKSHEVKL